MVRSRLGLKAMGLCALVLGLMAFGTTSAQAEVGAHWNVVKANGELLKIELGSTLLPQLEIASIEENTASLLFTTKGGTKVTLLCTAAKFDAGGLLIAHGGISLGQILFEGCVTLLNGTLSGPCKPKTTGKALGEILTEKGTGLIVLNGSEENVKITPDSGTLLAPIELGNECSIGSLVKVEGTLWIKDCGGSSSFLEEKAEHLIVESTLTHGLTALGQPATIDGSAFVRLTGEHAGLSWGGTPA